MGGGSGAATNVDSIPSPRRAAIEKTQAELSQEISARDARRKELEFLEKGGNPLDFRFGEFSLIGDLSGELDGLCTRTVCSPLENGLHVRYVEPPPPPPPAAAAVEPLENGGKFDDGISQEQAQDLKRRDSLGNGHTSPKNRPSDSERKPMCRFQVPPTCSADVREIANCFGHENASLKSVRQQSESEVRKRSPSSSPRSVHDHHDTVALDNSDSTRLDEATALAPRIDLPSVDATSKPAAAAEEAAPPRNEPETSSASEDVLTSAISEAEKKAHEDLILEKAETIKTLRKQAADISKGATFESLKRKSHWDFVLEEMAWLANDFAQERMWKTAAAAQCCRWAASAARAAKSAANEAKINKRRIASSLADFVMGYWKSSRALLEQEESAKDTSDSAKDTSDSVKVASDSVKETSDSEAVPMDVDTQAGARDPLQKYAIRLLKSTDMAENTTFQREASDDVWSEFPEESLFFVVPEGAAETYRLSAEASMINDDLQVEQDGLVPTDLCTVSEISLGLALESFGDDIRVSPKLADDDYSLHYMPGDLTISKKKRKKQTPKTFELGSGGYGDRLSNKRHHPSTSSFGLVPTKRIRTAAAARHRGPAAMSPGPRGNGSSASTNSQPDDLGFPEGRASESDSVGVSRKVASSLRTKKKKKKNYYADFSTDAISTKVEIENGIPDSYGQFNKRKSDQFSPMSSELGGAADTPGTPGSQGMQPTKKVKLSKHSPDVADPIGTSKLLRHNSNRDRIKRHKLTKGHFSHINPPGMGIPWSAVEDQAISAIVHDLGPNWELVSDVLSSSSQLKGIFRKPKDCKDRHKVLLERMSTDGPENSEDPSTSQSHASVLPGIPKGTARVLLQRLQGPMEEDTVKVHLERIVTIVQNHQHKAQNEQQENQELRPLHPSHLNIISQFPALSPLDFCDHSIPNGDIPGHGYPPAQLALHPGVRPNGLPVLSHLGPNVPASAALNAASAQRMAASMVRPLSAEEQRLRYARMVAGRSLQTQGNPSSNSLPPSMGGLPSNTNECTVQMLPSLPPGSTMMGMNRGVGLPLQRPGMISSGMTSTGLNSMLPPGGMSGAMMAAAAAGAVPSPANIKRMQNLRAGRCTEEQRQYLQELQLLAAQGNNPQAVAALNSLNHSNPMVSSPTQSFATQPPPPPQQQQQQLSPQQQQNHQQHYMAARLAAKEKQLQQQKRMLAQMQQQQHGFAQQAPQQASPLSPPPPAAAASTAAAAAGQTGPGQPQQQQQQQAAAAAQLKVQALQKTAKGPSRGVSSPAPQQQQRMFLQQQQQQQKSSAPPPPQPKPQPAPSHPSTPPPPPQVGSPSHNQSAPVPTTQAQRRPVYQQQQQQQQQRKTAATTAVAAQQRAPPPSKNTNNGVQSSSASASGTTTGPWRAGQTMYNLTRSSSLPGTPSSNGNNVSSPGPASNSFTPGGSLPPCTQSMATAPKATNVPTNGRTLASQRQSAPVAVRTRPTSAGGGAGGGGGSGGPPSTLIYGSVQRQPAVKPVVVPSTTGTNGGSTPPPGGNGSTCVTSSTSPR